MRSGTDGWRAFGELTRVYAGRLDRTPLGRIARLTAFLSAAFCAAWVIYLRVEDGAAAPTQAIPVKAARAALWLGAFPIALAAAHQRRLADRRDGLETLVMARGFQPIESAGARVVGALRRGISVMALPALVAGVVSLACAPNVDAVADRALVLGVVALFALVAGAVLGTLGAACEIAAPKRGRSLLLALLFVSWGLADIANQPLLSLTGGLGLALRGTLRALGLSG